MAETVQNQSVNTPAAQNQPANPPNQDDDDNPGFFQEDNGTHSLMRVMCFVSLLAAIAFGTLTILLSASGKSADAGTNGIYITFGFLIGAFAPKAVQKFAEQKIPQMGQK